MNESIEAPEAITPEEFDFAKWMAGAYKPTRGSTIHQRGDLIAELDRLREQIELAEDVPADERSLADLSPNRLREKYAVLAQEFHDSGLFVKVSGHTNEEKLAIAKLIDAEVEVKFAKDDKSEEANAYRYEKSKDLTYVLIEDALVSPRLTAEQLKQLHSKIGESEFSRVVTDYQLASNSLNEPDADFLPKPSTPDETAE